MEPAKSHTWLRINDSLVAGTNTTDSMLVLTRNENTLNGAKLTLGAGEDSICTVTLTPANGLSSDEKKTAARLADAVEQTLTIRFGPEYTSANGFAKDEKLAATMGVRWDLSALSTSMHRYGLFGLSLVGTFDYTAAVSAHEYRSCSASAFSPFRDSVTHDRIAGPAAEINCGAPKYTTVSRQAGGLDTTEVEYTILKSDSVRARVLPAWRGFLNFRVEYEPPKFGLRLGLIGAAGIQPDPRGLSAAGFSNTDNPLRPIGLVGLGIRKVNSEGIESFSTDILWGGVQNYYEGDVVVTPRVGESDSVHLAPSLIPAIGTRQAQISARLRLLKGMSLRAYATINSPTTPLIARTSPGVTRNLNARFPDLVRVAFLLDRDIQEVWDAVVGTRGAKDPGSPSTPKSPGGG